MRRCAAWRRRRRQVAGLSGDISSEAFVRDACGAACTRDYGGIDGLVNNAGVSLIAPAEETSAANGSG